MPRPLKPHLLKFLKDVGLIHEVPDAPPPPRTPLSRCSCFLHDGDNPNALMVFADGFACDTSKCHQDRRFGCNLEGLIRHTVFRLTGEVMAWHPAWNFARKHIDDIRSLVEAAKVRRGRQSGSDQEVSIPGEDLASCLDVPSPYFLQRGYSADTLVALGVGDCKRTLPDGNDRLKGWAIVPVCNGYAGGNLAGYSARNPNHGDGQQKVKWAHSVGLPKDRLFYNKKIAERAEGPLFICEGPGEVFAFRDAGFHAAIATLGGPVSEGQQFIFLMSNLERTWHRIRECRHRRVYIAADNDAAGLRFAEETKRMIRGHCTLEPTIILPPPGRKDFGEATPEEIRQLGLGEPLAASA